MFGTEPGKGLQFSLIGIPISIDWSFLFVPLMASSLGLQRAAIWTAVIFVGVLLHELGHALAMRRFGFSPRVSIYALGGLTFWPLGAKPTPAQDFVVSGAGPAVSVTLGLGSLVALSQVSSPGFEAALRDSVWINLVWGAINLLPLMPLDGSHLLDAAAAIIGKVERPRWVGAVSLACGLAIVAVAIGFKMVFLGFIGGFAALRGWERLKSGNRPAFERELERAHALAWSDAPHAAEPVLFALRDAAKSDRERAQVANAEAWLFVRLERMVDARAALSRVPDGWQRDAEATARLCAAEDDVEGVITSLVPELQEQRLSLTATPLLASALEAQGRFDDVENVALWALANAKTRDDAAGQTMWKIGTRLFSAGAFVQCQRVCEFSWAKFGAGVDAFNTACCLVRQDRLDEAMRWLGDAVRVGMPQLHEGLDGDPDLEPLRPREDFRALRAGLGPGVQTP